MTKAFALLLLTILIGVLGSSEHAFSAPSAGEQQFNSPTRQTILHVSIVNTAFSTASIQETNAFLRSIAPDAHLIHIKVEASKFFSKTEEVRRKFHDRLRRKLKGNEEITHLLVSAHGKTEIYGDKSNSHTYLAHVGSFSETETSEDLKHFFAPLRGLFARNAKVVLNSCSTFCGSNEAVAARARVFLNELGIPDGEIYGATGGEIEVTGGYLKKGNILRSIFDIRQHAFYAAIGAALGTQLALLGTLITDATYMNLWIASSIAVTTAFEAIIQISSRNPSQNDGWNRGQLLVFRSGELISATPLRRYRDKLRIFGASAGNSENRTVSAGSIGICADVFAD